MVITDLKSSLRALTLENVLPQLERLAPVVCFASLFVFPKFDPNALKSLFSAIEGKGRV